MPALAACAAPQRVKGCAGTVAFPQLPRLPRLRRRRGQAPAVGCSTGMRTDSGLCPAVPLEVSPPTCKHNSKGDYDILQGSLLFVIVCGWYAGRMHHLMVGPARH